MDTHNLKTDGRSARISRGGGWIWNLIAWSASFTTRYGKHPRLGLRVREAVYSCPLWQLQAPTWFGFLLHPTALGYLP